RHVYHRTGGYWPTLAQHSMPWRRPRPLLYSGSFNNAVDGQLADSIPEKGRARVVLFLDEANKRYSVVLLYGEASAAQNAAGATYSVRYLSLTAAPDVQQTVGSEVTHALSDGDFHHHQIQIQTAGGTGDGIGAVALGHFPADSEWTIRLSASFRGDIDAWEFYSAETEDWLDLDIREELELSNVPIHDDIILSEEVGVRECVPRKGEGALAEGICARGTVVTCRYGSLDCKQNVTPWDFEVCDGRDSNCDGRIDNVDAPFGLRVPMVYVRQEGTFGDITDDETGWVRWPTTDVADRAFEFLNYTHHDASFGQGSTKMVGIDQLKDTVDLQAPDLSVSLFHRDLNTSIISIPMAHGARVQGAFDDANVEFRAQFANERYSDDYDYSDLLFASWYDDWRSLDGTDGDHVPSTINFDEITGTWNVQSMDVDGEDGREADSGILQLIWQNGGNLKPLRFDIVPNLSGSIADWRLYRAYTTLRYLDPTKPLQVKVEWVLLEETVCTSPNDFEGCRSVPYQCSPSGALVCPDADEDCVGCTDADGDGYLGYDAINCPEGDDCNDTDASVYPGAIENCDGKDTNCDGYVDAIGPEAIGSGPEHSCPDGQDICGPAECGHRMSCSCAGEVDGCYCREGLD
ncbi:MAG: putative metal-binding motif-containing protein, partial [Bradymonadaceae bacterium]